MRYLIIVLALLVCGYSYASSNNQSVNEPNKNSSEKQEGTKTYSIDTSSLENTIRDAVKEITKEHPCDGNGKFDPDCQVANYTMQLSGYTFWLVVVTAGLGLIGFLQFVWIIRQECNTKRLERAYVFPRVSSTGDLNCCGPINSYIHGKDRFKITAKFVNSGKTPAVINKIRVYHETSNEIPISLQATSHSEYKLPDGLVIPSESDIPIDIYPFITDGERSKIECRSVTLYIVGRIEYKTIFRDSFYTEFCWQYVKDGEFLISQSVLNKYT